MIPLFISLFALIFSCFMIQIANGMLNVILPLNMVEGNMSTIHIGYVMASYSVGVLLACLVTGKLINRASHIRTFAAAAGIVAIAALVHSLYYHPILWGVLRIFTGFGICSCAMVLESWLQDVSTKENRSRVLGIYMTAFYLSYSLGQISLGVSWLQQINIFSLIAISSILALIPLCSSKLTGPPYQNIEAMKIMDLYRLSPLGIYGSFCAGLSYAALLSMGTIVGGMLGLQMENIALFMFFLVLGGFILQYPIGKLSDVYDRRSVFAGVLISSTIINVLALNFLVMNDGVDGEQFTVYIMIFAFAIGGTTSLVYPMSMAVTFDWIDKTQMISATAAMIFVYALGSIIGPLLASFILEYFRVPDLLFYFIVVEGSLAGYIFYRKSVKESLPIEEQESFVSVPRTSAVASSLDPRVEYVESPEETTESV